MTRSRVPLALLVAIAALVLMCLPATRLRAAGTDLAWSACAGDGGTKNRDFACDADVGSNVLVSSFTLDSPVPGVTGVTGVISLIVANSLPVPPWWDYTGCRLGSISANPTLDPTTSACADWAGGLAQGGLATYGVCSYYPISNSDSASCRQLRVAFAIPSPGVDLGANQEYFAFNVVMDEARTTGLFGCTGCGLPVCIALNLLQLYSPSTLFELPNGRAPGSNFVTWQGGVGADCAAVPSRRSSWSQVKALYR